MAFAAFNELQKLLAINLRSLRNRKELTQEEAAEATGLNWRHWQKLEAAEVNVTLSTLAKICRGLEVDIRALFIPSKHRTAKDDPE